MHCIVRNRPKHLAAAFVLLLTIVRPAFADDPAAPPKPPPDVADYRYGPHPRNVLDLWRAKSERPTPLVVFIHGGGFRLGDKSMVSAGLIEGCLKYGISVAAANYRLSPEVQFPAHYLDCARAIQTLRHNAKEWNLDPQRVAASGGSAGGGTSLWLGFHDDLADPNNSDPVLRESTRLTCMVVFGAQCTYDPRVIQEIVGRGVEDRSGSNGFYGLKDDELDTPKAYKLYEEAAPVNYVSADDPPVFAIYGGSRDPLPPDAKWGARIHHPNFGFYLKERMDKLNIECAVRTKQPGGELSPEAMEFLRKHLAIDNRSRRKP